MALSSFETLWSELLAEQEVQTLLSLALQEDLNGGDWTTDAVFDGPQAVLGQVVSRKGHVVCGLPLARAVFAAVEPSLEVSLGAQEGAWVEAGHVLMEVRGDVRGLLKAERCVLNFLMRLCGVATAANAAAAKIPEGAVAKVYDTRKTTPGWRHLEKAAVKVGGAENHRFDLQAAILIKDNHIAAAGSIAQALARAHALLKKRNACEKVIEIEIDTLEQLDEAMAGKPHIILLDNFSLEDLRAAVLRGQEVAPQIAFEASGGVTLETLADIAKTGVHRISMGAITHSAMPVDIGLDLPGPPPS